MTKPTAKEAMRNNRPSCDLLAATAQIISPILLPFLLGCSTAQTLPLAPVAVSRAERTAEQAAKLLRITPHTLAVWRCSNRYGLPFLRIGRKAYYRKADLIEWVAKQRVEVTA